ncbi:MAG: hypothetical protein ACI4KF_02260 [Huintestinicola sp.]
MQEINIIRGDRLDLVIDKICHSDTGAEYIPFETDMIYMDVKRQAGSGETVIHKELCGADITDGQICIGILPGDTENITAGEYRFDVRLVQDDSHIYTIIPDGKLIIADHITDIPEGR